MVSSWSYRACLENGFQVAQASRPRHPFSKHTLSDNVMFTTDLIFYQFSRSKVERIDFSHFLSVYARDKLPTGRRLRAMMGSLVFCVEGYDGDPREVHIIQEVRRFYAAFHQDWPYWLYFCNLDQDGLKMM